MLVFHFIKQPFWLQISKIIAHYFICVLGYLLSAILWRQARRKAGFKGSPDNLLDILNNICLATLLEESKTRGNVKAICKPKEINQGEKNILYALEIENSHIDCPKLKGVGVYKLYPLNML